ncbi:anaerobic ribonucleoside-triphosphate reductase activating protein [Candidatus Falkowbacteria bacterium]|nr:anaerobic ribonucleoside-triphosphate reductase activating protein [Candidatus Falkowbacteria bacterium]
MIIGGLEKLTLIDYPGHLAAIVFTQGCNFRCRFCYNPMLVLPVVSGKNCDISPGKEREDDDFSSSHREKKGQPPISEDGLFDFLKKRKGKLEGIVLTGGEPTLYADLPEFIKKIREFDFSIKLDTNGTNPDMLRFLINKKLIDYIAMDLKSDQDGYPKAVGVDVDFDLIKESIDIIINSGLPHEFRTTCVPGFHTREVLANMGQYIKGADKWYLQRFKSDTLLLDPSLEGKSCFSDEQMDEFARIGQDKMGSCQVRGA